MKEAFIKSLFGFTGKKNQFLLTNFLETNPQSLGLQ